MVENKYDYGYGYNAPEERESFVDTNKGEVIDKSKLSPMDVIRAMANKLNNKISEPRDGCKHCFGRGYVGFDSKSKAPVPCGCLFRHHSLEEKQIDRQAQNKYGGLNREQKRKLSRRMKKLKGQAKT